MSEAVDYSTIDLSILPLELQSLINVLGLDAAVRLCKAIGGTRVYVPSSITQGAKIRNILKDEESFQKLVNHYKGDYVELPKIDSIERQMKHMLVKQLHEQGLSYGQIASETGFTRRWVIELAKDAANDEESQQTLF